MPQYGVIVYAPAPADPRTLTQSQHGAVDPNQRNPRPSLRLGGQLVSVSR